MNLLCPICDGVQHQLYHEDQFRPYYQCAACSLVFVPESFRLSAELEKARYDQHQNDPLNAGYRGFLNRLMEPMVEVLKPGAAGLDFGCGPGPTLAILFEEAGFACANYDPIYLDDRTVLTQQYDFVSCSEVIEHCYHPAREFERMLALLKPGGVLGMMTQWLPERDAFAKWFYIDDATHVCFFSRATLSWLAEKQGLRIKFCENSVTLFFV